MRRPLLRPAAIRRSGRPVGGVGRSETTAAELIAVVAARVRLRDLTIEEPEIEDIVYGIYGGADPGRAR